MSGGADDVLTFQFQYGLIKRDDSADSAAMAEYISIPIWFD